MGVPAALRRDSGWQDWTQIAWPVVCRVWRHEPTSKLLSQLGQAKCTREEDVAEVASSAAAVPINAWLPFQSKYAVWGSGIRV